MENRCRNSRCLRLFCRMFVEKKIRSNDYKQFSFQCRQHRHGLRNIHSCTFRTFCTVRHIKIQIPCVCTMTPVAPIGGKGVTTDPPLNVFLRGNRIRPSFTSFFVSNSYTTLSGNKTRNDSVAAAAVVRIMNCRRYHWYRQLADIIDYNDVIVRKIKYWFRLKFEFIDVNA